MPTRGSFHTADIMQGSESAVMSRSARLAPASVPVADAPVASARGAWGVLPMKSHGLGAGAAKRAASSTTAPSKSGPLVPAGPGDSIDVSGDEDAAASVGVGSRGRRAVAAAQKTHTASHGAEARAQSAAAAAPAVNSPAASNGAHGGAAAHPQHLFAPGSGPGLLSPHLLARVAGVANEDVADDALPAPSSMRGEGAHRRSGTASGRSSLSSSRSATKHASPSARPSAAAAPSAAVAPPFPPAGAASAVPASPPRSGRASASPGSPSDRLSTSSYSSVAPGAPRKGPRPAHNPAAAAHRRAMLATGASPGGSSMRRSLFTEESDDDDGDRR
jgi:Meckel syndrome type 1 protein